MTQSTRQFVRYGLVGILSNAIGYLLYLALTASGIPPKAAMSALFALAIALTFALNKNWSFAHRGSIGHSVWRYLTVYGTGFLLNLLGLAVFVDSLGWPHAVVQGGAIVVVAIYLFLAQKYWVFADRTVRNRTNVDPVQHSPYTLAPHASRPLREPSPPSCPLAGQHTSPGHRNFCLAATASSATSHRLSDLHTGLRTIIIERCSISTTETHDVGTRHSSSD
jgi:putative flippase GtrA